MPVTLLQTNEFGNLFRGNPRAHGVFHPTGKFDKNGKAQGEYRTDDGPATDALLMGHLEGRDGLGAIPISPPNLCQFGLIDLDSHDEAKMSKIRQVIYKRSFPIVPFRSKSGGLHLYLFFLEPQSASRVIEVLSDFRRIFGLPADTEIFPKQKTIDKLAVGNWINLPYYNADATTRYAIDEYGLPMGLDEALAYCKQRRTLVERVAAFLKSLPVNDGPPCLQTMRIMGTANLRNEYLFSFARYARAKSEEDWEVEVTNANNDLDEPLPLSELESTVLKSHRKKEYAYKCAQDPLKSLCCKALCAQREFGIGSSDISNLNYEELTQYRSDPPYYEWKVNGQLMRFFSEDDLLKQDAFRKQSLRMLHVVPHRLKESRWVDILNKAFANLIVKDVDLADDISPGSQFNTYLTEFLTKRAMAASRSQILMGRVFLDEDINCYIFRPKDLLVFIQSIKQFRSFSAAEIRTRLMDMQGEPIRYYIDRLNKGTRVWKLPKASLGEQDDLSGIGDIDFLEEYGEDF